MRASKFTRIVDGVEVTSDYSHLHPDDQPHINRLNLRDDMRPGDRESYGSQPGDVLKQREHEGYRIRLISGQHWEVVGRPDLGRFLSEADFLQFVEREKKKPNGRI